MTARSLQADTSVDCFLASEIDLSDDPLRAMTADGFTVDDVWAAVKDNLGQPPYSQADYKKHGPTKPLDGPEIKTRHGVTIFAKDPI